MPSLEEVKLYLRIDGNTEDQLLEKLIRVASSILEDAITDYQVKMAQENFYEKAEMVQLVIIQDLYENRRLYGANNAKDFSATVRTMIEQLRWTGTEP